VVRHAGEKKAFERERGEAKTKLARAREAHVMEVKRVLDKAASSKGARHRDSKRCNAVKPKLASTRTQFEEANCHNNSIEAKNCAAREGLMRQVEEVNRRKDSIETENCAACEGLMRQVEDANHRNDSIEAENCAAREGLMRQVEEANCSIVNLKAENISELERVKAELEEIAKENEELEWLADLRSNHVRTLAFERNQAKSELGQLRLERSTINAKVFDIAKRSTMNAEVFNPATLIPSPIDFGDLSGSFKRSFNLLKFHNHDAPPLILPEISSMIYKVDPCRRICIIIKKTINGSFQKLRNLGFVCPPNNEETTERMLGATVKETAQYLLHFINKFMSEDVWNGICFLFEMDHITPKFGAFNINRSSNFWEEMTINHHSNLQLIPRDINRVKGMSLIAVVEKTFDSDDGKFLRWKHIPYNVKNNHNTAEYLKNECHLIFNQWKRKDRKHII